MEKLSTTHYRRPVPGIGSFVCVQGTDDGIGRLVELDGSTAIVEYFESPAGPRLHRIAAGTSGLAETELGAQTRVYVFDRALGIWHIGRVDGGLVDRRALGSDEDHYHIRFPNGCDARVPKSALYVRWGRTIDDPTDYLASRITETPYFFEGRRQVVRQLSNERARFGGITGLVSAAIDLYEHQVTTVRRVLADPIQRYLLADEVGIGKTIEAGALIRQHIIDAPREAQVLVVVPAHLVDQWRAELLEKFFLADDPRVVVGAEEVIGDSLGGLPTMLIIDEAHRVALRAFSESAAERRWFERVRDLAEQAPRVLLLSGTPVLHQEDGFLAMLHLLDPEGHPLDDREGFRRRVLERQAVAEILADLVDESSDLFVEEAVARLESLFPDDSRLVSLCAAVRASILAGVAPPGAEIHPIRALRTHIVETYRLHRRLLRTRRDDPRLLYDLPKRNSAAVLEGDEPGRNEAFDFVDAWRNAADIEPGSPAAELVALWVDAALSHPSVLMRRIDARLACIEGGQGLEPSEHSRLLGLPKQFDDEVEMLRSRRRLIGDRLDEEPRVTRLLDWLEANPTIRKVVAFIDDAEVADDVHRRLGAVLGDAVIRHVSGGQALAAFADAAARVLVCDARAEEGMNLQRLGAALVHLDLPLDSNRIEQRIGRVDRLAARGKMRIVVLLSECAYEREWFLCLRDVVQIFERSVASLQYFLLDSAARIRAGLCLAGAGAITRESERMRAPGDGIEAELRRVRQQEMLDAVESDPEGERAFFEAMLKADEAIDEEGASAFDAWVLGRLQFLRRRDSDAIFHYVYSLHAPTLMPIQEALDRFLACVDYDPAARSSRDEIPMRPCTFYRYKAEKMQVGLMRVGHPFVDAVEAALRADDRGISWAMWRCVPAATADPELYFRFDFVISADVAPALDIVRERRGSPEAVRRRADGAFPQMHRTLWLDATLERVRDERVIEWLELPYSKERRPDGGTDVNLKAETWNAADEARPVADWGELCVRTRARAEQFLREDGSLREACRRHAQGWRRENTVGLERLQSRLIRLHGPGRDVEASLMDFEARIGKALAEGIESPSIRLDAMGAVYLSSRPLIVE